MADFTIAADERAAYEIVINAGTVVTFDLVGSRGSANTALITVHAATRPVYIRGGDTVTPLDPRAYMIPPMMYEEVPVLTDGGTLAITSAEDAIVSVARS